MKRIGLLGGSFNPAHGGHRRISLHLAKALALDEVWWLVSPGNPLKSDQSMAPLAARLASAQLQSGRSLIRPTAIESQLGTRYTVDTIRKLTRRFPRNRFIWLMGADNLAQFARWKRWRTIAATVPIAVVARPGYDTKAHDGKAWAWLRGFVRPASQARNWTQWSRPALVLLRFRPDPASATQMRASNPGWYLSFTPRTLRDRVTRRPLQ
jgi:nicotinate-nucleotide adenylyltransferase